VHIHTSSSTLDGSSEERWSALKQNVMTESPKLFPVGKVLWLDTDPSGVSPPAAVYEAPNDTFDHIALQPGMYRSHMPQFYLKQVESLAS
jgi:hypothetical protein